MSTDDPYEIRATCRDCEAPFTIPEGEQDRLLRLARERDWDPASCLPVRCRDCRRRRRGEAPHVDQVVKPTNTHLRLECARCGTEFNFGPEAQRYYASQGYSLPRVCRPCRDVRAGDQVRGA